MRTVSPAFKTLLAQESVSLFSLLKLSLNDGSVVCLTDCDDDILIGADLYRAAVGINTSALQLALNISAENIQFDILPSTFANIGVVYDDIFKSKLDGASVLYSLCNPTNLAAGTISLFRGSVVETKTGNQDFISLSCNSVFGQDLPIATDNYQQTCRADFGDSKCRYNIDSVKRNFVARKPSPDRTSTVVEGIVDPDGFFNNGTAVFTSGLATGVAVEIALSITLTPQNSTSTDTHYAMGWKMPLPVDIADGDTFTAWPGCDKTLPGGCTRWANTINFQGEPYNAVVDVTNTSSLPASSDTSSGSTVNSGGGDTILPHVAGLDINGNYVFSNGPAQLDAQAVFDQNFEIGSHTNGPNPFLNKSPVYHADGSVTLRT